MSYQIRFFGQDFSLISEAANAAESDMSTANESFDYLKILNFFINDIDSSGLDDIYVNFSNYRRGSKKDCKRIRSDVNPDLFGGLVGVIKKRISIPAFDCLKDSEVPVDDVPAPDKYEFDIVLQITSRFDAKDKPYFLCTMLKEASFQTSTNYIPSNDDELFDFLLLFVYKKRLMESYDKGYYRAYTTFEKNNDRFRGSLDVARHIKNNIGLNNGCIAYRYREKSIDNYLNHLIVEAYMVLKKRHPELVYAKIEGDPVSRSIINVLKCGIEYPKYDKKTLISKNTNVLFHPYYMEYEELRKISLKIIRNEGLTVFSGASESVEGVVFYVPDLWEMFVESMIRTRIIKDSNIRFEPQNEISIFSYANGGKPVYTKKTYPDYVFYRKVLDKKDVPFMVLDAKFKVSWGNRIANESSMDSKDLSDYDKCIRDMNSLCVNATGVVFPTNRAELSSETAEEWIESNERAGGVDIPERLLKHSISEFNLRDVFYTFPVYIPAAKSSYSDWKNEYDSNCERISIKMKEYIVSEKEYSEKASMVFSER